MGKLGLLVLRLGPLNLLVLLLDQWMKQPPLLADRIVLEECEEWVKKLMICVIWLSFVWTRKTFNGHYMALNVFSLYSMITHIYVMMHGICKDAWKTSYDSSWSSLHGPICFIKCVCIVVSQKKLKIG